MTTLKELRARADLVPTTLESLKARTKGLAEEPSAAETFYEQAIKAPVRNLYGGYLQSGGGLYDLGANALEVIGRLGATDREGKRLFRDEVEQLRGLAQKMYGDALPYMDDNVLAKIYQGLGAAPEMIAELVSGTRLFGTASKGFAAVEALRAADKPEEVPLAAAKGALMGKVFEAAGPLKRPERVGALATIGGTQAAVEGGDVSDVTAGAVTLGTLGLMGGRGQVSLRDLRRRAARVPRQEPTIAPRTATPEDILELTERVQPPTEPAPVSEPVRATPPGPAPSPELRPEGVSQEAAPRAQPSTAVLDEPVTVREAEGFGGKPIPKQRIRRKPLTLAEFVSKMGGVQDQTGELKAMDAHRWHRDKPFRNRLVRGDGLSPDYAREAAAEAGYLKPDSTIDDLYQALDRDLRGQTVYSERDVGDVVEVRGKAEAEIDRAELEDYADRLGIPQESIEQLDTEALANTISYEQAVRGAAPEQLVQEPARAGAAAAGEGKLPDLTPPVEPAPGVPRIGRLVEEHGDFQIRVNPNGSFSVGSMRSGAWASQNRFDNFPDARALAKEFAAEERRQPTTEATPQGPQIVLPGAERTSGKEFVEVQADKRIRGTAVQKPADEGLFDVAGRGQTELFTFPGPLPALQKQWQRNADQIIDWLAEGQYSPFARYLKGYPFKDPTMGRLPERAEYLGKRGETQGTIYRTNRMAGRLNDVLRKAPVEAQRAALDYLTTEGADPKSLPPSVRGATVAAKSSIKKVGRELVRRGLLSQEAYDRHADAYLPRVYLKHLMERSGFGAGLKVSDQGYLKKRTDLPEEYRDLYLGEVKDVGFLVTKAMSLPARDLAMIDFLRDLSQNPEWVLPESIVEWTAPGMKRPRKVTPYWLKSEAGLLRRRAGTMPNVEQRARAKEIADGMDAIADSALGAVKGVPKDFRQMPDNPRYGDLRGLVVRKEIHDDIVGASGMWVGEKGAYDKTFDKLAKFNAFWKMMKVPFNPPTQVRNMVSNGVLLDISGVPFQRLPILYTRAFHQIRKNGKYYRIAVKHGVPASTFTAEELYRIRPDLLRVRGEKGGVTGKLAKMGEPLARLANKPGDLYQFSETWGKVVKIIDAMEREGMTERDAVAAAQETLFDYSLVPNLVRSLRTRPIGAPFITFYFKAFPAVMKGAIRHPGKMAKYFILPYVLGDMLVASLNDVTPEDVDKLRKALPRWMQDQGHVYIFPYRDESGRWAFTNYGYFLPWGLHERVARNTMELATGDYEGSVNDFFSELGVLGGPVPQIGAAMLTGVDPWTGREIVKDTDPPREQLYKLMMYAWRMGGPSFLTDQGVAGHMQRSLTGTPNYYGDPPLSLEQAAGRGVGINIYPVDPEASRGRNIRRKVFEIKEQHRAMRRGLRNRRLDTGERKDIVKQHREQIKGLTEDLREYKKRSKVHPNLRARSPGSVTADSQ